MIKSIIAIIIFITIGFILRHIARSTDDAHNLTHPDEPEEEAIGK